MWVRHLRRGAHPEVSPGVGPEVDMCYSRCGHSSWIAFPLFVGGCEIAPPEAALVPEDQAAIERLADEFVEGVLAQDWQTADPRR
jgi:hypothetical protein